MNYQLVKNDRKYWEFIRNLRNNSQVKKGFIQQKDVETDEHEQFMNRNGERFYICLLNDTPVGYVRSINGDISVATSPDYQKMGIGKFMINEIMKIFPESYAKVKIENEASLKLFESCGFEKKYYVLEKK